MAKNIFLPTSEFERSNIFSLVSKHEIIVLGLPVASTYSSKWWTLHLARRVGGGQVGMERLTLLAPQLPLASPSSHRPPVSDLLQGTRAAVTAENSTDHISTLFCRRATGFF